MNKKEQEKLMASEKTRRDLAWKYYTILNYICNKNSHPMPRGVDFEKLFDDVQDFEQYLLDESL